MREQGAAGHSSKSTGAADLCPPDRDARQISRPRSSDNRVGRNGVEYDSAGLCVGETVIELFGL
jgi:hypothetical protein